MKKEPKDMHFNDVWKLPFKSDPSKLSIYVWDNSNHVCFNYLGGGYDLYTRIIALLNGEEAEPFKMVESKGDYISVSEIENGPTTLLPVLMVRGWGHLTGCGALHLPAEEAKRIQMELVDYAVQKLQGK